MIATEIPVTLELPEPKIPRSPGIHVSSIIRCIATEQGILKAEWAEELSLVDVRKITDQTAVLRMLIGLAWEEQYFSMLPDIVYHPGETKVDGIYLSHDGESLSVIVTNGQPEHMLVVHEAKATYKSTRTVGDLSEQWMWLAQIKAYCKALKTRYAFLHVLFLCGDYSRPIKPLMKMWALEFTQEEIDENWQLIVDYRDHRLSIENGFPI